MWAAVFRFQATMGQWENALEVVNPRLVSLEGQYSPAAASESKRWLALQEEALTRLSRPPEELESVQRAIMAAPPRDPALSPALIDLTRYYNASLYDHRGWGADRPADLRRLPEAFVPLHGVSFDLRGVIQLESGVLPDGSTINSKFDKRYPDRVEGIAIHQEARAVHFLLSAHWGRETTGVEVARLVIHFEDGSTAGIPLRFVEDIADWYVSGSPLVSADKVGWRGRNGGDAQDVVLSEVIWKNPTPRKTVSHIDFISTLKAAAPFLLGITLE